VFVFIFLLFFFSDQFSCFTDENANTKVSKVSKTQVQSTNSKLVLLHLRPFLLLLFFAGTMEKR